MSTAACVCEDGVSVTMIPEDDISIAISCDADGVCTNTVTAALDVPAGHCACVRVDEVGHSLKLESAQAEQTDESMRWKNRCAPIQDIPNMVHQLSTLRLTNVTLQAEWENLKGTINNFNGCAPADDPLAVCETTEESQSAIGKAQTCGLQCVVVLLGTKPDNSCPANMHRRFYTSVCVSQDGNYGIYSLAFGPFTYHGTATINGNAVNVGESNAYSAMVTDVDFEDNTFSGWTMAVAPGAVDGVRVGPDLRVDPTDCGGYCGLTASLATGSVSMQGACATAEGSCTGSDSSKTCTATVATFDESAHGSAVPYSAPSSPYSELTYNASVHRAMVTVPGTHVPIKGNFTFEVPNTQSVVPQEAATNVPSFATHLLPQNATYEDVVALGVDGTVATSSKRCAFTLLANRTTDRLYSMRNAQNVEECDLVVSNGTAARTVQFRSQTKSPDAMQRSDIDELWTSLDTQIGSATRSSGLTTNQKIGIGVGVGVGGFVVICVCTALLLWCCVYKPRRERRKAEQEAYARNEEMHNAHEEEDDEDTAENESTDSDDSADAAATGSRKNPYLGSFLNTPSPTHSSEKPARLTNVEVCPPKDVDRHAPHHGPRGEHNQNREEAHPPTILHIPGVPYVESNYTEDGSSGERLSAKKRRTGRLQNGAYLAPHKTQNAQARR